jgi:hypothetical protein
MKYWEIIADNLKKAGWSLGYVAPVDCQGRTIGIADAHRDGKCFVVHADEMLTAFVELEMAVLYPPINYTGLPMKSRFHRLPYCFTRAPISAN